MTREADPSSNPNAPQRDGSLFPGLPDLSWMTQDFWGPPTANNLDLNNPFESRARMDAANTQGSGGDGFNITNGFSSNPTQSERSAQFRPGLGVLKQGVEYAPFGSQGWLNNIANREGKPQDWGSSDPNPNGGSSNSGYSAAAAVAAMLKSIEESYNRQVQGLDQNKASANTGIQNAYSQFRTNTDANNNVYQQGANQISADVSNRAAQSMQQAQQANQQIQQSVGGLGGDIGALRAQAQGNELALQGSNNAQQDLTARIAQIVAANHSSTQGSGDLVRQGAVGNLENNYTGMLNALMSSKEQQIAQANQSAYSGGGGGGGSSSSEISYQDALKERLAQRMFMDYDSGNDPDQATLMYQMALNDPAAFATAFFGQQTAP